MIYFRDLLLLPITQILSLIQSRMKVSEIVYSYTATLPYGFLNSPLFTANMLG